MKTGSIYHISDKELYEGFVSAKKQLSDIGLRKLAAQRGILYAGNATREQLCDWLSVLTYDYHAINEIADLLSHGQRRVRCTRSSLVMDTPPEPSMVALVLDKLRDAYASSETGILKISRDSEEAMSVHMQYTETDLSRTTLHQKQERTAEFQIVVNDDEITIRAPSTDMGARLVTDLRNALSKESNQNVNANDIALSGITDPHGRTQFFTDLMASLPSMVTETVVKVRVSSEIDIATDRDDEEGVEDFDVADTFAKVLRAELDGSDLIETAEYQRLIDSGFFITDVRFRSRDTTTGHVVEFIAGFSTPADATGFHFDAASISKKNVNKNTAFRSLQGHDRIFFIQRLESAAVEVYRKLVALVEDKEAKHEV